MFEAVTILELRNRSAVALRGAEVKSSSVLLWFKNS
jgi:hypothetical protein